MNPVWRNHVRPPVDAVLIAVNILVERGCVLEILEVESYTGRAGDGEGIDDDASI